MKCEKSRKRNWIKVWQIANVNSLGMDKVVEEGKKMFKMNIENLKVYLKSKGN